MSTVEDDAAFVERMRTAKARGHFVQSGCNAQIGRLIELASRTTVAERTATDPPIHKTREQHAREAGRREGLLEAAEIAEKLPLLLSDLKPWNERRTNPKDAADAIRAAADALPQLVPSEAEPVVSEAEITTVAKAICHADGFDPEQIISTTHAVARANYEYPAWEDYTTHARGALEAAARVRSAEGRL